MEMEQISIKIADSHKSFLQSKVPVALDGRHSRGLSPRIHKVIEESIDVNLASEAVENELAAVERFLNDKPTWEDRQGDV